jgi:hypothetical protein
MIPKNYKFRLRNGGAPIGLGESMMEFRKRTAIYHLNSDWTEPSLIQILYRKLKWFFFKR